MATYYRTDIRKTTFAEIWRISSTYSSFLSGCKLKLLNRKLPVSHAFRYDDRVVVVPPETVPQEVSAFFGPAVEEFESLGAQLAFYHTAPAVGKLEGYSAVLLAKDRYSYIVLVWVEVRVGRRPKKNSGMAITSQLQDGSFFTTTNLPRRFNLPPAFKAQRVLDGAPAVLFDKHQQGLRESESPAIRIQGDSHVKELIAEVKRVTFEWHFNRGVYLPLTTEEKRSLGVRDDD
jgi:hypothetical protein